MSIEDQNRDPISSPSPSQVRPDLSALRMNHEEVHAPSRGRALVWVLVLALLLVAGGWALTSLPLPWLLPEVETTQVRLVAASQASTVLTATGYTYARQRAAVGAKIIGRVVDLRVDEGDAIGEGDVIAVLDSDNIEAAVRQAEAEMLEAEAQLADARREAARLERLYEDGVVSRAEYDAAMTRRDVAEARLGTARATLEAARAELAYTVIRAPISGVVIERKVEVGEMVAPGGFTSQQSTGAIVRIADPGSLEVEADINESYISRLRLGQPAEIQVDAVPGHPYRGRLRQIVPTADRQRAVVEVKVTIDDADERLVPDMSCNVNFLEEGTAGAELAEAEPRVMVARQAVLEEGGEHWVFELEDGRLRRRRVTLGEGRDDLVEVLSGLSGGETVARGELDRLEDGMRVRAVTS